MWIYVPMVVWLACWVWLLADCLRRDRLPPLFGARAVDRAFWIVSFALLDPLLTLLYLALVRFGRGRGGLWRAGLAAAGMLLSVLAWTDALAGPATPRWQRRPDGTVRALGRTAGALTPCAAVTVGARQVESSRLHPAPRGVVVLPRHLRVTSPGGHPVAVAAAAEIAHGLAELAFVERVDVVRGGGATAVARAPDLTVRVEFEPAVALGPLRYAATSLAPVAGTLIVTAPGWETAESSSAPWSTPVCSANMRLRSTGRKVVLGLAIPSARAALAWSDEIEEVREALLGALRSEAAQCGWIDELPESFHGVHRAGPRPAFLDRVGAAPLVVETDVLVRERAVWAFAMPDDDELARIRAELAAAGFEDAVTGTSGAEPWLKMRSGSRRLTVAPADRFLAETVVQRTLPDGTRERETITPPMAGVRYFAVATDPFSREELAGHGRDALAAGRVDAATALWPSLDRDALARLAAALRDEPVQSPYEWIARAGLGAGAGDEALVERALRSLAAVVACGFDDPDVDAAFADDARAAAERRGRELPAAAELTLADYLAAGFADVSAGAVAVELPVDRPAFWLARQAGGVIVSAWVATRRRPGGVLVRAGSSAGSSVGGWLGPEPGAFDLPGAAAFGFTVERLDADRVRVIGEAPR